MIARPKPANIQTIAIIGVSAREQQHEQSAGLCADETTIPAPPVPRIGWQWYSSTTM